MQRISICILLIVSIVLPSIASKFELANHLIHHVRTKDCLTTQYYEPKNINLATLGDCIQPSLNAISKWNLTPEGGPLFAATLSNLQTTEPACLSTVAYWSTSSAAILNGQGEYGCRFSNAHWKLLPAPEVKQKYLIQQVASKLCLEPINKKRHGNHRGGVIGVRKCDNKNINQYWEVCEEGKQRCDAKLLLEST